MSSEVSIGADGLGRLERVELRVVWQHEAHHFTPWLAKDENLRLLGEAIDIELNLEAVEAAVGPFRADIVCHDASSPDTRVLIENQLARTDHSHLGQLMTYAAGASAITVVWIAERFTEEHRAAVDWLNEVTREGINLFGLEIELWRIGDSKIAPKFNVVCKPNEWVKAGGSAAGSEPTDTKRLQLEFWTAFRDYVEARGSVVKPTKPRPQVWMNMAIGRAGFWLAAVASTWNSEEESYDSHSLRAEFVMGGPAAEARYQSLLVEKSEIETELGERPTWHQPTGKQARKIYFQRAANLDAHTEWPSYHEWLLDRMERLHKVFGPRIRNL